MNLEFPVYQSKISQDAFGDEIITSNINGQEIIAKYIPGEGNQTEITSIYPHNIHLTAIIFEYQNIEEDDSFDLQLVNNKTDYRKTKKNTNIAVTNDGKFVPYPGGRVKLIVTNPIISTDHTGQWVIENGKFVSRPKRIANKRQTYDLFAYFKLIKAFMIDYKPLGTGRFEIPCDVYPVLGQILVFEHYFTLSDKEKIVRINFKLRQIKE